MCTCVSMWLRKMPPKHLSALLCSNQNMSDSLGLQVSWVVVHRTGQGQGCLAAHILAPLMLLPLLFAAGLARNPDQPWDCMQVAQTVSSCCMPCSYFNSVRRRLDTHYVHFSICEDNFQSLQNGRDWLSRKLSLAGSLEPKTHYISSWRFFRESAGFVRVVCHVNTLAIECALRETLVEVSLGDDICVCS